MQDSKKTMAIKKLLEHDNEDPAIIDAILDINRDKESSENTKNNRHWFITIINTLIGMSALAVNIYK